MMVKKAYGKVSFVNCGIEFKGQVVMLQLYKTLVRLNLEFCVLFWSPIDWKDVETLKGAEYVYCNRWY